MRRDYTLSPADRIERAKRKHHSENRKRRKAARQLIHKTMIEPNENRVVIIGHPESGKSTLADELALQYPDYKVYRTDDYVLHGYERSIYALLEDIERDAAPKVIVEGVQGYRLLRKGAELGTFDADLILVTGRPPVRNVRAVENFGKALDTVFSEYLSMKRNAPRIVRI